MSVQELQNYTSISKYARWLEDKQRREIWPETVGRYEQMLVDKYPGREAAIRESCKAILARDVMPSMRGLQFGGKPVFQHNARIYNCTSSYCDRLRFFPEAFYLLLCGSGVGSSVQEQHIQYLPRFSKKRLAGVRLPKKVYRPADSIEGWADCHAVQLSAWHETPIKGFEEYHECEPVYDLSSIRPEGANLSFGIGKAPGPKPLHRSITRTRDLLLKAVSSGLVKLNDVFASDYLMHEADAVVSGGVRRAATILLFDAWSLGMINWKTGSWYDTDPQRARANISAVLLRNGTSYEDFFRLFEATRQFGEPGFFWTDDPDCIANPCVEIGFWCRLMVEATAASTAELLKTYDGPVLRDEKCDTLYLSGWQTCNLTTENGKTLLGTTKQEKAESFYERCRIASRLGTWQAGFTNFPYLGEVSSKIVEREALIGVSISGMMHHPEVFLDPKVLRTGAGIVVEENEREAKLIGINPAARTTCVKPDGNSASALGCFSGAGPGKFRRGFRIVQSNRMEPVFQFFRSKNPQACEPCVWSANETDEVIRFCCEYEGLMEDDLTATQVLENVRIIKENWVDAGKVSERCTKDCLSHNVSNTVRVRPGEWDAVARFIYDNRQCFSGVSLLSWSGDRDYPQAPFTTVHTEEEIRQLYGAAASSDYVENLLRDSCFFSDLWDACNCVLGLWDRQLRQPTLEQEVWCVRIKLFAHIYFQDDVVTATYLLKDVFNWRLWCRLKHSYSPVDYTDMVETENNVTFQQEIACAGGLCVI